VISTRTSGFPCDFDTLRVILHTLLVEIVYYITYVNLNWRHIAAAVSKNFSQAYVSMRHCSRIVLRVDSTRKREESTRLRVIEKNFLCLFNTHACWIDTQNASTSFAALKSYRAVCPIDTQILTVLCDMSKRHGMSLFLIYNRMKKSYSIFYYI
jgi:hypothetical protein